MSEYPVKVFSKEAVRRVAASLLPHLVRPAVRAALAGLVAAPALLASATLAAAETDRSLKLFFTHTGERATITFKRDGRFDPKGLAQINRLLRDWRKNEPARMDPRLLDLVWEVYDRARAKDYIHIVSAYRSPATNSMLRGRSRNTGVAKNSQHMLGKAMDFYIPGVKLATLRAIAMQAQVGGVGYYPTSGSPFVHLDVGNVRAWPRMSRQELARIFPDGKTMHLPANGSPLPGYDQAVADYRRRVGAKSIEIASTTAGEDDEDVAPAPARSSLLTAMLPTPRSRAEEALELQTKSRADVSAANGSDFLDLASLAVPVPSVRPVEMMASPAVETAVLAPLSALSTGSVRPQGAILELREPSASIALLGITSSDTDPQDESDAEDALVSWALSAPGTFTGMTAPVFVSRIITLGAAAAGSEVGETMPTSVGEEFDGGRFWSEG
ncbi:DUF882 domain-containing protein [Neorhizobium galegae]|uniref:DUF882 domain-containing protein n=1 Tax=Neorhizobium galegae TaxID=399 RepID=UPI000627FB16|nr:DUF882 domain-containing protein [Neorhizobium galegae]